MHSRCTWPLHACVIYWRVILGVVRQVQMQHMNEKMDTIVNLFSVGSTKGLLI